MNFQSLHSNSGKRIKQTSIFLGPRLLSRPESLARPSTRLGPRPVGPASNTGRGKTLADGARPSYSRRAGELLRRAGAHRRRLLRRNRVHPRARRTKAIRLRCLDGLQDHRSWVAVDNGGGGAASNGVAVSSDHRGLHG
jgi:hypothetical protein